MHITLADFAFPPQNPRHDLAVAQASASLSPGLSTLSAASSSSGPSLFGGDGFSFKDIIDSVNPLQQVPIVGSLYRSLSGDTISAASRLAGGALLGGPVGLLAAAVSAGVDALTGGDIGENMFAMLGGGDSAEKAAPRLYALKAYTNTGSMSG